MGDLGGVLAPYFRSRGYAVLVSLVIPGEPGVKERPRCGKRVRSTEKQKAAEAEIARLFQARYIVPELHTGPVYVDVDFWTRSASKDLDNMLKLVLDALNGVAWADDRQVVEVTARVCRDGQCGPPQTNLELILYGGEVIARETEA